jgi:hypothetical protein
VGRVEEAMRRVIARHEALRTRFELRDGQVVQLIVNFGKSMLLCNVEFMNLEMVRNHQLLWLQ